MGTQDFDDVARALSRFREAVAASGLTPGQVAGVLWLPPEDWDELCAGDLAERLGDGATARMVDYAELVEHVAVLEPAGVAGWLHEVGAGEALSHLGYIVSYREALPALCGEMRTRRLAGDLS